MINAINRGIDNSWIASLYDSGKIADRILDPSRGGIGIKLKIIRTIFISIIKYITEAKSAPNGINLKINEKIITAIRFESGPANATLRLSILGFLKLLGLIGTGFPQPKPNNTSEIVPITSRWTSGFKDKRPLIFAVSSPSLWAM